MKKTISALLLACILGCSLLTACTDQTSKEPDTSSDTEETESIDETTVKSEDESEESLTEPGKPSTLQAADLGLKAHLAKVQDEKVATATVNTNSSLTISPRATGSTVVTVLNTYGESVEITVTVDSKKQIQSLDYTPFQSPKNYVLAEEYGMSPSNEDNAGALQSAINALPNGGVVYVSKGTYKISFVEIKEGITLRLEGILDNYNQPYSKDIIKLVTQGKFAQLVTLGGDMFANHAKKAPGRDGAGNFTITGGIINMEGRARAFIWCCAENVLLENVIMKDCPNNHAIQVTGCDGVTIRNVMFAGYRYNNNNSGAELIQIESSHPGAIGKGTVADSLFEEHEYYHSFNVTFDNCYFGPSDLYDSPTYAIGHHGHQSSESLRGLGIFNCTFDNPRVAAFRAYAFSDVEIANCKFISDRANGVDGKTHYMMELNFNSGDTVLSRSPLVYITKSEERGGCQNYKIHDNTFEIGESSMLRGVLTTLASTKYTSYDAIAFTNLVQTERSVNAPVITFNGYKMATNRISDIEIYNNKINSQSAYCLAMFSLTGVDGLRIENNTITSATTMRHSVLDGKKIEGAVLSGCTSVDQYAKKFKVAAYSANTSKPIVMVLNSGKINAFCNASSTTSQCIVTFVSESGGRIERTANKNGELFVTPVADEGYTFDGYYVDGQKLTSDTFHFEKAVTVTLKFIKK